MPYDSPSPGLAAQLQRLVVEERPGACVGCGFEHNCKTHGCAVLRKISRIVAATGGLHHERIFEDSIAIDYRDTEKEFGIAAVDFYLARINERITMGKIYRNPLKTIWLWATEDRRTNQGFWTTNRGHTRRRKNYGGS